MMEDEVKRIQRTGTCRYCHQQRFVEVPEDADEEEINDTAMISTMNAYIKTGCIFPASVPKPIRKNRQGIVISKKSTT